MGITGNSMSKSHDVTAIFGGIGGLELGLSKAGHKTSLFCEYDADAVTVLKRRFPEVPVVRDIRRTDEVGEAVSHKSNLLTAGFPCTDLSQAGTTQGFAGGRSSLIRETIDLLQKRPFANVLIENVPNWRHLHRGSYLREVVQALEALGYRWAYRTLDARAFGVPQRRLRLFLFACLEGDPRDVLFHGDEQPLELSRSLTEAAHGFFWTEGTRGLGWGEDCVPTLKGGSAIGIPAPPAILMPNLRLITPDISDAERLQGFRPGWTDLKERALEVGGGTFNQRRRWLLVGNAVNVMVAHWIGKNLAQRRSFGGPEGVLLDRASPWPTAAWFDGVRRWAAPLSSWPVRVRPRPLDSFLSKPGKPLSLRATEGFYNRFKQSRLSRPVGFLEAIEAHLRRMRHASGAEPAQSVELRVAAE
ncbi:DNA (cytosine-5)-methyltransferase 1 [Rhizobiales bacterium GAS191]|nr:DNA (cytosine-5)-methyltransferase 1 [Rhizobiales bacterium GAS191]